MTKPKRLVFGRHRLPPDEREAPAWPDLEDPDANADPEEETDDDKEDQTP